MLAYLDTVIGFAVVMLIISLLITILTQTVSALVNHRGSNLLWGLKTMLANIDPEAFPRLTEQAGGIAREALTHCLISDSWLNGNKVTEWMASRSALLGKFFDRLQIASAIRPDELASVLREIAAARRRRADRVPAPADAAELRALAAEITQLLAASDPNAVRDLGLVANAVAAGVPNAPPLAASAAVPWLRDSVSAVRASAGKLEGWFGSIMDRVSQKFAMYMRIWTVAFSFLFALGTGLNAIGLMSDLYNSGAFRSALVAVAPQVNAAAASVQDAANARRAGADDAAADRKLLEEGAASAAKLNAIASSAGFQVLQFRWPAGFLKQTLDAQLRYLLGVMVTAGLLSLGAPFWFNALKSITNLRPVIASKESTESEQG